VSNLGGSDLVDVQGEGPQCGPVRSDPLPLGWEARVRATFQEAGAGRERRGRGQAVLMTSFLCNRVCSHQLQSSSLQACTQCLGRGQQQSNQGTLPSGALLAAGLSVCVEMTVSSTACVCFLVPLLGFWLRLLLDASNKAHVQIVQNFHTSKGAKTSKARGM
jgi:hypothetical protein